ncbi:hypothetical protein SteCoe_37909 [Stentor coeruleus]|uniref:Uncharacterized protein n=1 Tax=Stentor coeruleus TaxID=5963 RepID=A0A1R2AM76_9CILI|nr:hypothetical protein SteCoe_37909 [Stentor coeruleus]
MVKIKATEKLKDYLETQGFDRKDVYEYLEIRDVLVKGQKDILFGCSFSWPEPPKPNISLVIEKLRERKKEREYQQMIGNLKQKPQESLNELKSGMGMGMSMISVLFVGMLSGYYLGKYFFGLSDVGSLVISFVITVIGIYVEVALFVIRSEDEKTKKE